MTDRLPVALRALWYELPLLAAAGVAVCTASAVVLLLSPGVGPVAAVLAVVLVGPVWAGVVATTDAVVHETGGGVLLMLRNIRRHWLDGLVVGAVPGLLMAVALANWSLYHHSPLVLVPLGISCTASVLAVLASFSAFSLRVSAGLRGRELWLTALGLVARGPWMPLGVLAVVVVAFLIGTSVAASLLLLAPGPVALFASAGTGTVYRMENPHALHR